MNSKVSRSRLRNHEVEMSPKPDTLRRLDARPDGPLSREWRRSESKLIEYSGLAGRTYFCIRGLDETEEWFLLEEESPIQRRVDAKDAGENN